MDPIDIAQESSFISENEKRHYLSIIRTFKAYSEITQRILDSRKQSLSKHISKLRKLVNLNQAFLDEVIESSDQIFTNVHSSFYNHNKSDKLNALSSNVDSANYDKLKTTLKQIVRDWSIVGSEERSQCYQPIINAINSYFTGVQRSDICVLVPGAGLGRLAFDLAVDGYICQGNEVSLFMLFTSNYLINRGIEANTMCIYPWITNFSNNLTYDDQCSSVYIPDINTYSFDSLKFTMVAGNFLQVYRSKVYVYTRDINALMWRNVCYLWITQKWSEIIVSCFK
ncbi:hypothetical protein GJ496_007661 [Pomphorhynchus laevis]|nr:hypothetical protein GJ496_007661 [Pomphorhynchus laevis]